MKKPKTPNSPPAVPQVSPAPRPAVHDPTIGGGVLVGDNTEVMAPGVRPSNDWRSVLDQLPPQPFAG